MLKRLKQQSHLGDTTPPAAPAETSYDTIVLSSTLCKIYRQIKKQHRENINLILMTECMQDT